MTKKSLLFVFVAITHFCNFSCTFNSSQKNSVQSENSKVAANNEELKRNKKNAANVEPEAVASNKAVAEKTIATEKNDCSRNIKVAGDRKIVIPSELCFDEEKPADKSESVKPPLPGQKQANTLSDEKVSVRQVPAEVLRVIELITGSKPTAKEFSLIVSPNGQDSTTPKRAVKMYLYSPIANDRSSGGTYYFQKQNGKLKLTLADLTRNRKRLDIYDKRLDMDL